ncbi:hypothetical protein SLEP1_g56733 [Rubroshorea leprosula]|uniref:Retrotransposon Copia-like N-terminal domain-containing protein n=1 Tax=Rubroshorea leprosula TaxID=152421 RepID=A0AAV5MJL7_9ROSI|nr:hypothetical protein SLEP1_g56733 [Rubroshorea leprosula]
MTDTTAKNGSKTEKREIGILKTTDPDSPYFLHSSDDPGRVLVTTPLTGENYHTWRRSMQNALFAKNKMGFVDGSLKRPNADSPEYQAWTKCNFIVLSWLLNALSRDLQGSVAYVESAAEVWNDLHERFSQGNASRPIWDELQANEPVPTCTCGCTCGVAKEYMKILSTEPLPSLNKVYAMTTKEEKQQAMAASRSPIIEATALAAKMNHTGKSSMSGKPRCDHCKKVGHTKERCYEIIGYPVGWKIGPAKMKGKGEHQKRFTGSITRDVNGAPRGRGPLPHPRPRDSRGRGSPRGFFTGGRFCPPSPFPAGNGDPRGDPHSPRGTVATAMAADGSRWQQMTSLQQQIALAAAKQMDPIRQQASGSRPAAAKQMDPV